MRRPLATSCYNLDIRRLVREGWLVPNTQFQWVWRQRPGNLRGVIRVLVRERLLVLAYFYKFKPGQQDKIVRDRIPLAWTTGHHGGCRVWFQCPRCARRAAMLYQVGGAFLCRRCHGLVYLSQYASRPWAYGRRPRVLS